MNGNPDVPLPLELQSLSNLLEEFPETLALGNQELQATALNATKYVFDLSIQSEASSKSHVVDLMTSLTWSQAPQTRSRANKEAEKPNSQPPDKNLFDSTPLKCLYVDGMDEEQIWEQLDLRTNTICQVLDFVLEGELEADQKDGNTTGGEDEYEARLLKALEDLEREGIDMDDLMGEESEGSSGQSSSQSQSSGSPSGSDLEDDEGEENYSSLRDPSEDEDGDDEVELLVLHSPNQSSRKKGSRNAPVSELDDDFFNLAEFNADTERAEARSSSKGRLAEDDESDEDMDIDLFAHVDPVENFDEEDLEGNPDVLFYKDFFQPTTPVSAAAKIKSKMPTSHTSQVRFHDQVRVKKIKPSGKNKSLYIDDSEDDSLLEDDETVSGAEFNVNEMEWSDEDEEMDEEEEEEEEENDDENEANPKFDSRQTIERLKHDLFAEEEEEVQEDLTTHERRMATLRDQIVELESENVAKKDWVLMGEVGSRQRPKNSLLEEDLEFGRVMKAVPVITEEAIQSLEEIIKARILEGRFDDVIRLRPLDDKPFLPSKFFELQDSKSTQSLAQIYENDYVFAQSGVSSDDRDGKLKKEHDEISEVWDKLCGKLDALCNAHFVPKQPKATISTIANVATATLESALPTSKSTATMLAPEEIFATSSSLQHARSELTPVEKRALRTRERKARQRQWNTLNKSVDKYAKTTGLGSVSRQKEAALKSIVKHGKGVTVVGKKIAKDKKSKT